MDSFPHPGSRPPVHWMAPAALAAAAALTACGSSGTSSTSTSSAPATSAPATSAPAPRHDRDRGADGGGHRQHHHRSAGDVPNRRQRPHALPVREGHRDHLHVRRHVRGELAAAADQGCPEDGRAGPTGQAGHHRTLRRHDPGHLRRAPAVLVHRGHRTRPDQRPRLNAFGGLWYIVSPAGTAIQSAPASSSASASASSGGGGGY